MTNIPNIRFKGYTDDWEHRKLGEIGSIQTCKRIFKEQTSESGEIPFYKNGTIGLKADAYISKELFEEYKNLYPYPEVGDILISAVGSIGRTAEYMGEDEYFQDSNVVWLKTDNNINKKFLKVSYQVIKWLIEGSTVKHLYNDNILKSEIYLPNSQKEQKKIGTYFSILDHLITLHQRKCDETKELKKYMLQKMFPQNGKEIPEIRFAGFTDAWEQRKLNEIFDERNEQYPMSEDYPLMAFIANVGVAPKGERYDRSALINDEQGKKYKRTELGDFIYSSNNLEAGSIGLNNYGNACISPVYSIFKLKNNSDSDFLGRMLLRKEFINAMVQYRQGVVYGQWKIHESDFLNLHIAIPSLDEQRMIGTYFKKIDTLITLHQRKCDELREVKKFMLQNMFPQKG